MFYKTIRIFFLLISALLMLRFAFPKLMGKEVSQKTFIIISDVLPLNAQAFMYFTGLVELLIGVLLFASLFIRDKVQNTFQMLAYFFLLCTMTSGLIVELYIRSEPKNILVVLAVFLITIAISELSILSEKRKELL